MRFVSFLGSGRVGVGVEQDGVIAGFTDDAPEFPGSLDSLVARGDAALREAGRRLSAGKRFDPAAIIFSPPLVASRKIICVGLNYIDHAAEAKMAVPDYPTIFSRFSSGLVGHEQPLIVPPQSNKFDYEGELVAVIGSRARNVPAGKALDHVIGYSVFNDGSIRDYQTRTTQWTIGKNFDGTGGFGPYLVTADSVPRGARGLRLETRLNGQVVQSASTGDMVFDIETLVSMLSEVMTLEPGDLIVSGTPAGVGAVRNPPLFMKPGDVCEVSVEGIGCLRNPIR